jgi:hypothetical protein
VIDSETQHSPPVAGSSRSRLITAEAIEEQGIRSPVRSIVRSAWRALLRRG